MPETLQGEAALPGERPHPVLVRLLGLTPLLAVSDAAVTALTLAVVLTITLVLSSAAVSLGRALVPPEVRLPVHGVITATVVAGLQLLLQAWSLPLADRLGIYLALVAMSSLVLAHLQETALPSTPLRAMGSGLRNGIAAAWVLLLLGSVRELLARGSWLDGLGLVPGWGGALLSLPVDYRGLQLAASPAGGLLVLAGLVAATNAIGRHRAGRVAGSHG